MGTLTSLLGIRYPIFQGGMSQVSDGRLAAAVAEAGGLGMIAGGNMTVEAVRNEIKIAKKLTDKPFGLNIVLLSHHAEALASLVVEEGVKIVATGAGNPARFIEAWKVAGVKIIPVIPSVAIAKKMCKLGVDAVVAEGMEAGGHIGKLTTMALVPQVVDAVDIPVVAAGGIADGRGMAAAFMLGASGVQLGTRFIVAKECCAHEAYKQCIIESSDISSTVTGAITGHPIRVLRNDLSKMLEELDFVALDKREEAVRRIEALGEGALRRAVVDGDVSMGAIMAGQIAGLVRREQGCDEIIREIIGEFRSCLGKAEGLLI